MTRLDIDALIAELDVFHTLFRFEQLPAYAVDDDGDDYHRWAAGAPEPTWPRKQPWLDVLHADRAAGRDRRRVRRFTADLTDYERYACDWGYAHNAPAGENIRVLRPGEHRIPNLPPEDFWVVDDHTAIVMNYDDAGGFLDATRVPDPSPYIAARDRAWEAAEPFEPWWAQHPELHTRREILSA